MAHEGYEKIRGDEYRDSTRQFNRFILTRSSALALVRSELRTTMIAVPQFNVQLAFPIPVTHLPSHEVIETMF